MRDLEIEMEGVTKEDPKEDIPTEISLDSCGTSSLTPEVKHPLENTWTLWYYRKESGKSWEDSLKEVRS